MSLSFTVPVLSIIPKTEVSVKRNSESYLYKLFNSRMRADSHHDPPHRRRVFPPFSEGVKGTPEVRL